MMHTLGKTGGFFNAVRHVVNPSIPPNRVEGERPTVIRNLVHRERDGALTVRRLVTTSRCFATQRPNRVVSRGRSERSARADILLQPTGAPCNRNADRQHRPQLPLAPHVVNDYSNNANSSQTQTVGPQIFETTKIRMNRILKMKNWRTTTASSQTTGLLSTTYLCSTNSYTCISIRYRTINRLTSTHLLLMMLIGNEFRLGCVSSTGKRCVPVHVAKNVGSTSSLRPASVKDASKGIRVLMAQTTASLCLLIMRWIPAQCLLTFPY